jgi:gliding motility-associated-like protein/uncharacterized repeat protein (TIGR01451 family)
MLFVLKYSYLSIKIGYSRFFLVILKPKFYREYVTYRAFIELVLIQVSNMKLNREHISFMNLSKIFKGILFLGMLLLMNIVSSQNRISVTSIDNAAEEVSSGAQNLASFTISRNFNSLEQTEVNYTITGSASQGTDYTLVASGTVLLGPAIVQNSVTFDITAIDDDNLVEGIEDIIITLTDIDDGPGSIDPANDEVTIEIADNDVGVINFSFDENIANPYRPTSTEGLPNNQQGQFRLESDKLNATGGTVLLFFTVSGSAGQPGTGATFEYDLAGAVNVANNRITFPNATQFRVVDVLPFDDTDPEPDQEVTITLTGTNNPLFTIGAADTATVTIIDDDCAAGDTAPVLNNNPTAFCGAFTVPLDDYLQSTRPPGAGLVWSTNSDPSVQADWVPFANDSPVSAPGTYFGFFRDEPNECYSPTVTLQITQNFEPTAGNNANGSACNNDDDSFGDTLIDLDDLLSPGVDPGTWAFVSGPETINPPGNNRVQFQNRQAGTYVYSYTTNNAVAPCINDSATFTIVVSDCDPCVAGNVAPVQNNGVATTFCGPITSSLDDYAPNNGPNGTVLRWATSQLTAPVDADDFIANNSNTENNPDEGTYFGYYFDATNSCVSPALQLSLSSTPIPSITGVSEDEIRCGPGTVPLTASASNNAVINWYTSATGGSAVSSGPNFSPNITETTTYFVEAVLGDCSSTLSMPRQAVVATVVPQPSAGTPQNNGNASSCNDASNGPTTLDLDELIAGEDEGEWAFTSGPTPSFAISATNEVDFETLPDGDYVFTFTTTGAEAPCSNESSVITISVNDCDIDTDLDGLFDGPESTLGTDPNNRDTDGDGILDGVEVGLDVENPLDEDEDGIIDALDSNIADTDDDGVVDQLDPANEDPCIPNRLNGVCDFDDDGITDSDEDANQNGEIDEGESDPDDPCDPDAENAACNAEVDLEVLKTVDDINALIGDTVVFTVSVNNLSDSRATSIIIGDLLESGFQYDEHSVTTGTYDPVAGEWSIPSINASGSAVLEVTVTILEGGIYTNTAEVLSVFQTDIDPNNDSASVTLPIEIPEGVNLVLEKKVSLGLDKEKLDQVTGLINTIDTEVEVFYFIKVINKSRQDAVSNIRVIDVFTNDEEVDFEIIETTVPDGSSFNPETGVWLIDGVTLEREQEIELSYRVVYRSIGTVFNTAAIDRSTPRESLDKEEDEDSKSTATVVITTRNEVEVGIIYNQFSPNNDGLNDNLKINTLRTNADGSQVKVEVLYNIQIFNRYGNLVFETTGQNTEEIWDGSWKGKNSPDGTYFYTLDVQVEGEGSSIQKGWIQLIR